MNNLIIVLELIISLLPFNIPLMLGLFSLLSISLIIRKYNKNLEFIYLMFLFFSYIVGLVYDFYDKINYYDTIVHSLFGIISSIYALPILKILKKYNLKNKLFNVIFILVFTLSLAAFWEIIEFTFDIFLNSNIQISLNNTMKDIICALVFSILYIIIYLYKFKKIEKIFINKC